MSIPSWLQDTIGAFFTPWNSFFLLPIFDTSEVRVFFILDLPSLWSGVPVIFVNVNILPISAHRLLLWDTSVSTSRCKPFLICIDWPLRAGITHWHILSISLVHDSGSRSLSRSLQCGRNTLAVSLGVFWKDYYWRSLASCRKTAQVRLPVVFSTIFHCCTKWQRLWSLEEYLESRQGGRWA